jgi:hypothetical protein
LYRPLIWLSIDFNNNRTKAVPSRAEQVNDSVILLWAAAAPEDELNVWHKGLQRIGQTPSTIGTYRPRDEGKDTFNELLQPVAKPKI